jgi:5-methyltetrahydropteroyltriglutamate--homocysteine methyltransferase
MPADGIEVRSAEESRPVALLQRPAQPRRRRPPRPPHIEGSNPRHDHEWRVWEEASLPDGKVLIPGAVGHASDFIEHPRLVADRLARYARLVGRERVIAGTDCGLGGRVGHDEIGWAKLDALVEGARLASEELWPGAG